MVSADYSVVRAPDMPPARAAPGQSALAVERANAGHNASSRLQRRHERREMVIDAFFGPAGAVIAVRSLIRQAWVNSGRKRNQAKFPRKIHAPRRHQHA